MSEDKSKVPKKDTKGKGYISPFEEALQHTTYGISRDVTASIEEMMLNKFDEISNIAERKKNSKELISNKSPKNKEGMSTDDFQDVASFINRNNSESLSVAETELKKLADKNDKFYSLIKDFEMMPVLVPQINRILQFLVNETVSPDIQNDYTFVINYSEDDQSVINKIKEVRGNLRLDSLLRSVYKKRFSYGRCYYRVIDYRDTFETIYDSLTSNGILNEASTFAEISSGLTKFSSQLSKDDFNIQSINESVILSDGSDMKFELTNLNITVDMSPAKEYINSFKDAIISESISNRKTSNIFKQSNEQIILNESFGTDRDNHVKKILQQYMKAGVSRASIDELDPARVYKLKASGRTVGYFYLSKSDKTSSTDSVRDRLMKSKSKNQLNDYDIAKRKIVDKIAGEILDKTKANLGVSSLEEMDLFHDFLINNEIYKGDKNIKFYHKDDIFDFSREDDSIYLNAVYFVKMYASLISNNVMTKILRGRGRQIHTVNVGASPDVAKYLNSAIMALSAPETRLAGFSGPFESILNPLYAASDIVIPAEDGAETFIRTDYIEGQNVDMDTEFLKFLLNSIINSFGIDSAILDVVNGNVDFAKTIAMISSQVVTLVKNEQLDLIGEWTRFIQTIMAIEEPSLVDEIDSSKISVKFFKPNSVVLSMTQDELNNAKSYAETLADIHPMISMLSDDDAYRQLFIFEIVKEIVSLPWEEVTGKFEKVMNEEYPKLMQNKKLMDAIKAAKENKTSKIVTEDEADLED